MHGAGLGAANHHGSAVDVDVSSGVVLDHISGQGVEGIQASLFTGDSLHADELVVAVIQANAHGLLGHGHGPVGTSVALNLSAVAQSAQQHLHESIAGQGASGTEGAVSIAGDNLLLRAVSDVAGELVGDRHVLEGSAVSRQSVSGGGSQDQVADDLGSRATGQGVGGVEGTVGVTIDDVQRGHHVNSFFIGDLAVVREVLGASADGDQRHGHRQSQNQRKELLHGDVSSL